MISIKLEAHEIVEFVDESLGWMAIASTSGAEYIAEDFRRASLTTKIDKDAWAYVECDSVNAFERNDFDDPNSEISSHVSEHDVQNMLIDNIRKYERPCVASIVMHSESFIPGSSGDKMPQSIGPTAMSLESISMLPNKGSKPVKSAFHIPEIFDVYVHQIISTLPDGRASGMVNIYCHNGKRFLDNKRMPLTSTGENLHPWERNITHLLLEQNERLNRWTVELSLTKNRTGIGLQTDAIGAREFAKAAASCTGTASEKRRPLVHWVSEHMRASRRTDADPHLVRAHLRGRQQMMCGSYFARIYPSAVDCKKACNGKRFLSP